MMPIQIITSQNHVIMPEPANLYSISSRVYFDDEIGPTQNVILSQGRSALKATIKHIDKLHRLVVESPLKNAATDSEIAPTLSDLCYQAGLASTILFNDAGKGRFESEKAYELRQKRIEYVKKYCSEKNIQPTLLPDRGIRNSLTHIDERLADILTKEDGVGWLIDSAIGRRTDLKAQNGEEIRFCRSYEISEDRIIHLDHELDLKELRRECIYVLAAVFGIVYDDKLDEK